MSEESKQDVIYDLEDIEAPILSGFLLKTGAWLSSNVRPIRSKIASDAHVFFLRNIQIDAEPTPMPIFHSDQASLPPTNPIELLQTITEKSPEKKVQFCSVLDYYNAYRSGSITPTQIAEAAINLIKQSNERSPPIRAIIKSIDELVLAQAQASTERWTNGTPISILDGVPIAIKDEVHMSAYSTHCGTSFLGNYFPSSDFDCEVVRRLKEMGAIIIGKANMHELGLGTTGYNVTWGSPLNPYCLTAHTGGSSSGSASAVAMDLCPIAIGCDGGGSVRIPSAFCGLVGLKPTFGRISEHGAVPIAPSVGHIGPLAASAIDCAIGYVAMAGPDEKDPGSLHQPPVTIDNIFNIQDLSDVRIGIYRQFFEHAEPEIVQQCDVAIQFFRSRGARIVDIVIPELETFKIAHLIAILNDMKNLLNPYIENWKKLAYTSQIPLSMSLEFSDEDIQQSQRERTRAMKLIEEIFQNVDVIATPSTGTLAPEINFHLSDTDEMNGQKTGRIMRFAFLANLTGVPAISFPVGYGTKNKPIGLQFMSKWWDEELLLRLAIAHEVFALEWKSPEINFSPLKYVQNK